MSKLWITGAVLLLVIVVIAQLTRRHEEDVLWEPVDVRQGDLTEVLHESGSLTSREPVLVKNKFYAILKWIIEDGSWVEEGQTVFIVNADKTVEDVGRKRLELIALRQELRLAELRKQHAEQTERLALEAAQRQYELEQIRFRILTTPPVGGRELLRCHEELLPLESENRKLRDGYENALDEYLTVQDAFLEVQDACEAVRNRMLRAQALIDQLKVETDRETEAMQPEEQRQHAERVAKLATTETDYAQCQTDLPPLRVDMAAARDKVRRLEGPLAERKRQLDASEGKTRELYVRLEIEKRGLQLAKLQLDEEAAKLELAEAGRKLDDAQASFADGVISKATLDDLANQKQACENKLKIIQQKIKIAAAPPAPEEQEEANSKLEKAKAAAESAQQAYDQAIAMKAADLKIIRVKIQKLAHEIDYASQNFAELIEANIETAKRELEILENEQTDRREELTGELAVLAEQLVAARERPAHIYRAPVSGLVRLKQYGGRDRPTQAGDEWWEEDAVVMIYPPANLEVTAYVNEVNLSKVHSAMPADIIVPSLGERRFPGEIYQVAGIAKDKFARKQRWFEQSAFADVTQFELRIRLTDSHPDLRQGMTVIAEMVTSRRENCTWLPLAAVEAVADSFFVNVGRPPKLKRRELQGECFGTDSFVITDGLRPGDTVWIERRRNL